MANMREELTRIGEAVRGSFEAQKRVLSFDEYLALFAAHPYRHSRDASRYMCDCFEHFGAYEVERPWGKVRRFRLFDQEFLAEGEERAMSERLVGHELLQESVFQVLSSFVREGRANRLILLHGPNGSAKSTFALCIMRALENYSTTDEGSLYRFSWIFPRGRDGQTVGFGSTDDGLRPGESFAHLEDHRIDVKMPSELREHPLMLLPSRERRELVQRMYREGNIEGAPPEWIWSGELGHKNKQILEALLTAYRGDMRKVLNHVQVERYYISRRYRVGAVTIGPQMAVDASERQITADRTLNALPASLSSLTLFEPYGELVDAAGGMVEYSDLLKRPLDAWKYLLIAIETGEVPLSFSNLPINSVLLASSNELHLAAFREHPEYNSFRGRLRQVRVPYLLDYQQEQSIYDSQIVPRVRQHVAPHATFVAALWAVLTRLRRPQPERYEDATIGRIAADLTPMEKADLLALGTLPRRLAAEDAKIFRGAIETVYREGDRAADYEGLAGASPREIRMLLLDAASDARYKCLSPIVVLERIATFCQRSDYDFLKQSPERGYHDHAAFVPQIRERWLDRVGEEIRSCTGLVEEAQYLELFNRYVTQVSYWVKSEKHYNRVTGQYEDADEEMMRQVEAMLDASDDFDNFRRNLISIVAAHAIDHPGQTMDYPRIFPRHIETLREATFRDRKEQIQTIAEDVLALLDGSGTLDEERRTQAQETFDRLCERYGYQKSSVSDALGALLRSRFHD